MAAALDATSTLMQRYAETGSAADAAAARDSVEETHGVVERHLAHEDKKSSR